MLWIDGGGIEGGDGVVRDGGEGGRVFLESLELAVGRCLQSQICRDLSYIERPVSRLERPPEDSVVGGDRAR